MQYFYALYLLAGTLYTAVTFPEYRKIRAEQFSWIGGTLYIGWSVLFWLPMVAYMLIFRRPR